MTERKAPARKPRKATAPEPTVAVVPAASAPVDETAPVIPDPHPTGYIGDLPDPTPNEHYTLAGVIAGLPVPDHER